MTTASHPHLRLVGSNDEPAVDARSQAAARRAVAQENQAARGNMALNPTDPRWVVAVRAYSQLQGTTLTPERRKHVHELATLLGVRSFEANVIMAIVQDHARHGRSIDDAAGTIALIDPPEQRVSPAGRWIAAIIIATTIAMMLIAWVARS